MKNQNPDGQFDFLGLLSEYTDDSGAKVRVREPGGRKVVPRDPDPFMQLSFNPEPWPEPEPEPVSETVKTETVNKPKLVTSEVPKQESAKEETRRPVEAEPPKTEAPRTEAPRSEVHKTEPPKTEAPAPAPRKKPAPVPKTKSSEGGTDRPEALFKQCERCWCFDCKHNSRGPAVPRELCGKMMPCPACKGCELEGMATICEIGNATEGCMLRATEEGIYVLEEV